MYKQKTWSLLKKEYLLQKESKLMATVNAGLYLFFFPTWQTVTSSLTGVGVREVFREAFKAAFIKTAQKAKEKAKFKFSFFGVFPRTKTATLQSSISKAVPAPRPSFALSPWVKLELGIQRFFYTYSCVIC